MPTKTYRGRCHCGAVRFSFSSDEITTGIRCNCSICIRKGSVMSPEYIPADALELEGQESLAVYQFGDLDMHHLFCRTCGISPFSRVANLPADFQGRAQIGDCRVNLGCVDGVDALALEIKIIDGRSL